MTKDAEKARTQDYDICDVSVQGEAKEVQAWLAFPAKAVVQR